MTAAELNIPVCQKCGSRTLNGECRNRVTHIDPVTSGHYLVLEERTRWLLSRIDAGKAMGLKTDGDQKLYDALTWALERLDK